MKNLKTVSILLLACLIYFTSCQKNTIKQNKPLSKSNNAQNIKIEDGYLVFKNWKDFKTQLNKVLESNTYSTNWDKQMGFTSANDILNNVGDKLESCDSKEKAMRVFNKYRNIISFSKDSTLQLTNIPDIYSYIVNKDGLVKIGKSLYKFTRNKEFIILNGEKSKISLLKSSQETDLKKGIIAFNLKPASNFSRIPLNYGLLIDTMSIHPSNYRLVDFDVLRF